MENTTPTQEAIKAQREYCERTETPHFAPTDGRCYNCRRNIYGGDRPITPGKAGSQLVTGCQYCHHSFCECF